MAAHLLATEDDDHSLFGSWREILIGSCSVREASVASRPLLLRCAGLSLKISSLQLHTST